MIMTAFIIRLGIFMGAADGAGGGGDVLQKSRGR